MKSNYYTNIRKYVIVHTYNNRFPNFSVFTDSSNHKSVSFLFHQSLHPKSFQNECFSYLFVLFFQDVSLLPC